MHQNVIAHCVKITKSEINCTTIHSFLTSPLQLHLNTTEQLCAIVQEKQSIFFLFLTSIYLSI